MNWRRGLFRLWILLSVIWLLIIGALSYSSVATPFVGDQGFVLNHETKLFEAFDHTSPRYAAALEAVRRNLFQKVGFKREAPGVIFFSPVPMTPEVRSKKMEIVAFATDLRQASVDRQRLDAIGLPIAIGLVPPLALLLFGAATAWALIGFVGRKGTKV